jgi:hypothetical protein
VTVFGDGTMWVPWAAGVLLAMGYTWLISRLFQWGERRRRIWRRRCGR